MWWEWHKWRTSVKSFHHSRSRAPLASEVRPGGTITAYDFIFLYKQIYNHFKVTNIKQKVRIDADMDINFIMATINLCKPQYRKCIYHRGKHELDRLKQHVVVIISKVWSMHQSLAKAKKSWNVGMRHTYMTYTVRIIKTNNYFNF